MKRPLAYITAPWGDNEYSRWHFACKRVGVGVVRGDFVEDVI